MKRIKTATEKNFEEVIEKEDTAIKDEPIKKKYSQIHLITAINDLALKINNAYFRSPFIKCPSCSKNSTILAHFGEGGADKIGNLKKFDVTKGDVISWKSDSFTGISIIKDKNNGVLQLETAPFETPRKEPAVVERLIIPEKYRSLLGEMAQFLADTEGFEHYAEGSEIGEHIYPDVITKRI